MCSAGLIPVRSLDRAVPGRVSWLVRSHRRLTGQKHFPKHRLRVPEKLTLTFACPYAEDRSPISSKLHLESEKNN